MKNLEKLTSIIESILFVSGTQIAISDIAEKLEVSEKDVLACAKELQGKYSEDCGINLLIFNKKFSWNQFSLQKTATGTNSTFILQNRQAQKKAGQQ